MKKILIKIFLCVLACCMLFSFTACDEVKWNGTTMKNWGDTISNDGFISETQNYIYYINGIGNSSKNNTFGVPVKGALMAVDKNDFTKTEIVVPELFVAEDYKSGLFISGNYVYYGTPNTDKDSSGSIANYEMVFKRTKLDGTNSETFFKVSSFSVEYRFVEQEGVVYLVYFDSSSNSLKCYNTSKKTSTVIAKKDEKAKKESLDAYTFVSGESVNDYAVIYTVTVYQNEDTSSSSRTTEVYNKVYGYKVGEGNELIKDGSEGNLTYTVKLVKSGYVFYSEKDENETEINYVSEVSTFSQNSAEKIFYKDYAVDSTFIVSDTKAYVVDADKKTISEFSFLEKNSLTPKAIIEDTSLSIINIQGDYIYYTSSDVLYRIKLGDEKAKAEQVSEGTISSSWYKPVIKNVGGDSYVFYADISSYGNSYIKYVSLSQEAQEKDDKLYLTGHKFLGKILSSDEVKYVEYIIDSVKLNGNAIAYEDNEGGFYSESLQKAQNVVSSMSKSAKAKLPSSYEKKLENYEKALEVSKMLNKLSSAYVYDELEDSQKTQIENDYNSAKEYINKLRDKKAVLSLIENNLKCYYYKMESNLKSK